MNGIIITKLYYALKASHPDDAAEVLLGLLISGKVPAWAFDPQNDDNEVRLDQHHWQSLSAERAEQIFREGNAPVKQDMRYGQADFQMHIFVPGWSLDLFPTEEPLAPINVGSKRGRRETIEWQVVSAGVAYLMGQENKPKNLEDLVHEISLWCNKHFGDETAPGETVLKDNFAGLFRLMLGEDPRTVFPNGVRPKRKRKKPRAKGK